MGRDAKEVRLAKQGWTLDLIETLRAKNIDPVQLFFDSLAEVDDPALKAKLLLDALDFIYPKRKVIEHTLDAQVTTKEMSHDEIRSILAADPFKMLAPPSE